jgi:PAS domain S-box-containing protein
MQLTYSPYILLPLVALLVALILVIRAWRHHATPITTTFSVLMSALAVWSLAVVLEHASLGLPAKIFWLKMSYFGIVILPATWLVFTLQYANREKWLTRRKLAILAVLPVITLVMVWTNDIYHLMWKDIWLDTSLSPPVDAVTHNVWFWVQAMYSYLLIFLGTLTLLNVFLRSSTIYRKQVGIMLLATAIPWVANFVYIAGIEPFSVIDPTPLAFAITGAAFFWGLSRFQLLEIMPIAQEAIFRNIIDGVIVLDTQDRVIELNPSALHIINRNRSEIVGQPYKFVMPGQAGQLDFKPGMPDTQAVISLGKGQTLRYYGVSISPIVTKQRFSGHLVLLHDDTGRIKAEADSRERIRLETELVERDRSEQTLRASEAKFRNLVENAAAGILTTLPDGRVLSANRAGLEIFGYDSEEEIKKKSVAEHYVDPDNRRELLRLIEKTGVAKGFEVRMKRKDDSAFWASLNIITQIAESGEKQLLSIIENISERKRVEEALHEGERRYREIFEFAAVSIWEEDFSSVKVTLDRLRASGVKDLRGYLSENPAFVSEAASKVKLLDINRATLKLFGAGSKDQLISSLDRSFQQESYNVFAEELLAIWERQSYFEAEAPFKTLQGKELNTILSVVFPSSASSLDHVLVSMVDITERKQTAAELSRLNEELRLLNSQLEAKVKERTEQLAEAVTIAEAANKAKSEFLASMSHELRTPLNAIIGFSQMLQEQYFGQLNEKQSEYVTDIIDSGTHLLSLINDILDLSKIESGKMELDVSKVKMADLLRSSVIMVKEKALAHSINLEVRVDESMEALEIMGDERKLKQVLFNLLSNATKFTPDGGAITIEGKKNGQDLSVTVSDSGIGITDEEQKKLFQAFYQASGGIKGKTPGTGLGLAITKSIIEKHGGRIWVESDGRNKGSRFIFTLPVRYLSETVQPDKAGTTRS